MSGREGEVVEVGSCDLCRREMIRASCGGVVEDVWHPHDVERACPQEPDDPKMRTRDSFEAWQAFYASGARPGRPGHEHFVDVGDA